MPGPRFAFVCLALETALASTACAPNEPGASDGEASTSTTTTTSTTGGTPACGGVPTTADGVSDWLGGGDYLAWTAESGAHESAGPHFGQVRVFVNECLAESLAAGNEAHPEGAVAVKELFGNNTTLGGWSVMVKLDGEANGSWYWYESYNGSVYGQDVDDPNCTGCHSDGVDSMRTTWPLD